MSDLVDGIIAYETGELDAAGILALFSDLVKSGKAWRLQGHYGRTAASLIDRGFLTPDGAITPEALEAISGEVDS